jgi:heat shock protein HslJ
VPAQAAGERSDLFGRDWVSTGVRKDGDRVPLFDGTKIRVDFNHREDYDVLTWRADCNYFGTRPEITDERLVIGQIEGTDMGCFGPPRRQDRWMLRFFRSDPKWRIRRDDRLKLTAGERVIRLHRQRR